MTEFLSGQPASEHGRIMDLLAGGAVQMSLMLHMDFFSAPVRICNRAVSFTDLKDGHQWAPGDGLLVGLPDIDGGDGSLAPGRSYRLGMPQDRIKATPDGADWRATIVEMVGDVTEYRRREITISGQLFDPETNAVVGYPFTLDSGLMDRMSISFSVAGAVISLSAEGYLSRKGVPVYGMQTYLDQKRRYPDDEGLQFVTESGRLVVWTNW